MKPNFTQAQFFWKMTCNKLWSKLDATRFLASRGFLYKGLQLDRSLNLLTADEFKSLIAGMKSTHKSEFYPQS